MEQNKKLWVKLYIWIFFGILFSLAFALMRTSDTFDKSAFFGQQRVYDFKEEEYTRGTDTCIYNPEVNYFVVVSDRAKKNFSRLSTCKNWKYLNMTVENLNLACSEWTIYFSDSKGNLITQYKVGIQNGENVIDLKCPKAFQYIGFKIQDQVGLSFTITSMQLRQTQIIFDGEEVLQETVVTFVLYLFVSIILWMIRKKGLYASVDFLQGIYKSVGDTLGLALDQRLDIWAKNRLRTLLFWFIFTFMTMFGGFGLYTQSKYYKYGILAVTAAIVLIGLLAWEKPLLRVNWRSVLPASWFAFWVYVCVSDFMVSKFYKFTGYVFLFAVGFFFFIWNNMSHPKQIRNNMIHGLELTLPFFTIYCMLFRQKKDFVFYNGVFRTREEMAGYALMLFIAFLAELCYCLRSKWMEKRVVWMMLYGIGASVSAYFLYITWTVLALLAAMVVILLFAAYVVKNRKGLVLGILKSAGILFASFACSVLVVVGIHTALRNLPEYLDTDIHYSGETLESGLDEAALAAAKAGTPGLFRGVHSSRGLEKQTVWTNYLRHLNLFGNDGTLTVLGTKTDAQSGYLDMVYRYGLFVLIPYLLMLFCCLYHAWKEHGFLMLGTTLAFGILMLTQCIDRPFAQPIWIVFYLGMGIWFGKPDRQAENSIQGR